MTRRAGKADLPLHGHVPKWLADRVTRLGAVISEAVVHHYGRDELLRRLLVSGRSAPLELIQARDAGADNDCVKIQGTLGAPRGRRG
jgi:hypothetical protein